MLTILFDKRMIYLYVILEHLWLAPGFLPTASAEPERMQIKKPSKRALSGVTLDAHAQVAQRVG